MRKKEMPPVDHLIFGKKTAIVAGDHPGEGKGVVGVDNALKDGVTGFLQGGFLCQLTHFTIGRPGKFCGVRTVAVHLAIDGRRIVETVFILINFSQKHPRLPHPFGEDVSADALVEQVFPQKGITIIPQQKILSIEFSDGRAELHLNDSFGPLIIDCRAVILATGRFLSGGLDSSMDTIIEPLLNIPVTQPDSREQWYRHKYLDLDGHAVHRAGIEIDDRYRPLGTDGKPLYENVFAAGIILAHQDWIRQRCGAGIAISTAYKAVESAARFLSKHDTPLKETDSQLPS